MTGYLLRLTALGACLLIAFSGRAQVVTWTGNTDTRWELSSNWSPANVPGATSDVLVDACVKCPRLADEVAIRSLSVRTNGKLDLNAHTLTLSDSAVLSSAIITSALGTVKVLKVLKIESSTFNGSITIECAGATENLLHGGNIFNDEIMVKNSGTGLLRMAAVQPDTYVSNAAFIRTSSGALEPAFNGVNALAGNLTATGVVSFATGASGQLLLNGAASQSLMGNNGLFFRQLAINKSTGTVLVLSAASVTGNLTLTQGNLQVVSPNVLLLGRLATVSGGSNTSYVLGNVRKTGNTPFIFPVGDQGKYRPLTLGSLLSEETTPADTSVTVMVSYLTQKQTTSQSRLDPRLTLSDCEHWLVTPSATLQFSASVGTTNACNYRPTSQGCLARCLGGVWQRETVGLPVTNALTSSQNLSFPATTTALTIGYWGRLTLNTTAVHPASFSLTGAGINLAGQASGTPQSILPLTPVFVNAVKQTLVIDLAGTAGAQPLQLSVELDSNLVVSPALVPQVKINGTWNPLRADYYTTSDDLYAGKTISFFQEKNAISPGPLRTNLQQGVVLNGPLIIYGLTNLKARLEVVGRDNTRYVSEKKVFRGDTLLWDSAPAAGNLSPVTEFILTVQDNISSDFILKGQFIKK